MVLGGAVEALARKSRGRRSAASLRSGTSFLARLASDRRGNTLALIAAAMIPLLAMVGSGVDMTRAYMAQNRFRQACDAGSLAGRRLLSGATVSDAVRTEATKYFQFNFPQGQFQASTYQLGMSVPTPGTLKIETTSAIPTTIMKMFGYDTLPISVVCSATQDFINTDIMMVFDLSGSMNCTPTNESNGCSTKGEELPGSRLSALKDAAKAFYDTLEPAQTQLHQANLRLRYGFVNYSSAVNVGWSLYAKNPDYLVRNPVYTSSRWPNWVDATSYVQGNEGLCKDAYSYDQYASMADGTGVLGGYWENNRCYVILQTNAKPEGFEWTGSRGSYNQASQSPTQVDASTYITSHENNEISVDVARYIGMPESGNGKINGQEEKGWAHPSAPWAGCIEERKTDPVLVDGGSSTTAPTTAWDLNIDMIPNENGEGDDSRWKPLWPELVYWPRNRPASMSTWIKTGQYDSKFSGRKVKDVSWNGAPAAACPTPARRLREYHNDKSGFYEYIDKLKAEGGTYHDLGVIWGARFISPTGIFKSANSETNDTNDPDNPVKLRGFTVKKYMIFMTDGEMYPQPFYYSSYGVEGLDGRVIGTPSVDQSRLNSRHLQRFRMACNAAKAKGIDVWVIAFATGLTKDMTNCASKPAQASGLSTRAQLIAKFQEIGTKIGSLRLSQ